MKGNPKVVDYLNKALRHELTVGLQGACKAMAQGTRVGEIAALNGRHLLVLSVSQFDLNLTHLFRMALLRV